MGYLVTHRKRARISKRMMVRRRGMGDTPLIAAQVSSSPQGVLTCSADGQFKLVNGVWMRLSAGEVCTAVMPGGPVTNANGAGVTVSDAACAAAPADGINVEGIVFAPVELAPITYSWTCHDASMPGFTREQRATVTKWLTDVQKNAQIGAQIGGRTNQAFGNISVEDFAKALTSGKWPIKVFTGPDGDGKQVLLTVDPTSGNYTFVWQHNPTAFQTLDTFLTSLSPISTDELCKMIPIASKIPNPYAIAGSLVLQMSGKCPPTCPAGMLYDATSKQCACPPGSAYNPQLQRCVATNATPTWLLPAAIIGGVGILLAIALKKKGSPTP